MHLRQTAALDPTMVSGHSKGERVLHPKGRVLLGFVLPLVFSLFESLRGCTARLYLPRCESYRNDALDGETDRLPAGCPKDDTSKTHIDLPCHLLLHTAGLYGKAAPKHV